MNARLTRIVNDLIEELDTAFNATRYTEAGLIIEALDSLNEIGKNEQVEVSLRDCD